MHLHITYVFYVNTMYILYCFYITFLLTCLLYTLAFLYNFRPEILLFRPCLFCWINIFVIVVIIYKLMMNDLCIFCLF